MTFRIASRWFEHRRLDDDISLVWEPHANPFARCNMWHVRGRNRDLLVDTGLGIEALRPYVETVFGRPVTAVLTHAHFDHSGSFHEFDDRWMHDAEAREVRSGSVWGALCRDQFDAGIVTAIEQTGYHVPDLMVDAVPRADFDLRAYRVPAAEPTRLLAEGQVIDLGDRQFDVMHLPGHSPGGVGLWEARTGTLFSGDTVYDGPLIDTLPESRRADYESSMRRLLGLPVRVVHAGHDPSFDGARLQTLAAAYLSRF